jgi:hypothetical protein
VNLAPYLTPAQFFVDFFARIEVSRPLKKNFFGFGNLWVWDATIIDWADSGALRLVKVPDALGAAVVRDDINRVTFSVPFGDLVPLLLGVASYFKNCFVGAFWEAGSAIDALFGNFNWHVTSSFSSTEIVNDS